MSIENIEERCPFCDDFKYGSMTCQCTAFGEFTRPEDCGYSDESLEAIIEAKNNPNLVLVPVPKEVDSLVGWKDTHHGPIKFDPFTGAMKYNSEGIRSTDMVWFWTRPKHEEKGDGNE